MTGLGAQARVWTHKLLVISDLHLTTDGERVIGLDPEKLNKAVLAQALERHSDASALILLGDLAHSGQSAAYTALRELLAPVKMPILPMVGNHDRREAFVAAFPDAPHSKGGFIQTACDFGNWRALTLDTLLGPPYREDEHFGFLCEDRLEWLKDQVARASGRPLLVCTHHPPFQTGIPGMDKIRLSNGAEVLDILADHGSAYLICGHVHRTISGTTRGVPWSMIKSPCHQGPLDLNSGDSSLSLDETGGYAIVLLTENGVIVHNEDLARAGAMAISGYPVVEPHN